jgi:hypothetical protein
MPTSRRRRGSGSRSVPGATFSPFSALADTFILQDHNRRCLEKLEPYIREDKRALKWLRREAERGIGMASPGPGGVFIDWD